MTVATDAGGASMDVRQSVRERYGSRVGCGEIPSLGCGSPVALADLRTGEVVVDLGSGPGRDLVDAARIVGPSGRAIGVDMTPEMVERARRTAASLPNVEARLGEMEAVPLPDASADVVISNCAINLSPDKPRVFREAYRILRPGGRMVVQDVLARRPFTDEERSDPDLWAACVSGAIPAREYRDGLRAAGFAEVEIREDGSCCDAADTYSAAVIARKP